MTITALWLPIILSAVVLFFASAIAWTMLPHHQKDYQGLPNEDRTLDEIRKLNLQAGRYIFPFAGNHKNAQDPEFQKKWTTGPNGTLTIFGQMSMGKNMFCTFLYFLVVSAVLAYLGSITIGANPDFMRVFRVMGTAGILTFTAGAIPNDIWFRRPMFTNIIDGVVYGLIVGLIFASLWPSQVQA